MFSLPRTLLCDGICLVKCLSEALTGCEDCNSRFHLTDKEVRWVASLRYIAE